MNVANAAIALRPFVAPKPVPKSALRDAEPPPLEGSPHPTWSDKSLPRDGKLWQTDSSTTGGAVADLVNRTRRPGQKVTILTNTHGDKKGRIGLSAEYKPGRGPMTKHGDQFLHEDIKNISRNGHARDVRVLDVTRMSERELQKVLNEGGDIYAAWCHSESTHLLNRTANTVKKAQ